MAERGRVRVEPAQKRVRALLAGHTVLDTQRALLVWESPYYPQYYIPRVDVHADLKSTGQVKRSPSRGDAEVFDVVVEGHSVSEAAWQGQGSPIEELRDSVRFDWGSLDAWFEEDEEVFIHPRSPYTRIDVLPSSRHVRVEGHGVVVAESVRPVVLFETGLPPRYYLPKSDVRMDLLLPSATRTGCPYKGEAEYWSIRLDARDIPDAAWSYRTPLQESARIAGLVSFTSWVDGVDVIVDDESV